MIELSKMGHNELRQLIREAAAELVSPRMENRMSKQVIHQAVLENISFGYAVLAEDARARHTTPCRSL